MYLPDETAGLPTIERAQIPAFVRTDSILRATFGTVAGRTSAHRVHEAGALRLRFPKVTGDCEGIILNTAGGVAGGDRQSQSFSFGKGSCGALTTQSAEKIYRSDGPAASVSTSIELASGAAAAWLPQDSILFDGARLDRRLSIDMAPDATLTIKEGVVFGRAARGERMLSGAFHDRWRVRRDGKLILAEEVRLDAAPAAQLDKPALGNGATAIATIVHISVRALTILDAVRDALGDASCEAGASAWNGMLVVRLAGHEAHVVRALSGRVLACLLPGVSPRIWSC